MNRPPEVRVLDPNRASVESIRTILERVGLAVIGHEAPEQLLCVEPSETPVCIVSELALPGISGLELQRRLELQRVPPPCVFVTATATVRYAVDLMKGGAYDVFEKPLDDELAFTDAVQRALEAHASKLRAAADLRDVERRFMALSERGAQVVELALQGLPSKAIARELGISKKTVDFHRAQALRTLGASSMLEVAKLRRFMEIS